MTRLLTCGWETNDLAESGVSTTGTNGVLTVVSSTPTPRAGSYCLKTSATTSSFNTAFKTFAFAAKTEIWARWAFFAHAFTSEIVIAKVTDSGGTDHAGVSYSSADGLLRARQGSTTGGTLLGTASSSFAQDTWHVIEWRHQMTSLSSGTTEVWLDGVRVINFTGDNTAGTVLNVVSLALGSITASGSTTIYSGIDDIAINDTSGTANNGRPGDGRVVLLVPNGAGSNTGLTRGGTDSGANWSQVEELPPSMTDYVFGATAALRDTYALSDLPSGVGTINVAEVIALAQNSDAGEG
jgi:hypothetical protein